MTKPKAVGSKSAGRNGKTANKYPQESYAEFACMFQLEWILLQPVMKDTGRAFMGMEKVLWETFLPHLLFGKYKTLPPILGALSMFPIDKSLMGLHNIVTSAQKKYSRSIHASGELIGAVTGKWVCSTSDHIQRVKWESHDKTNNGTPQMMQSSRELLATKAPLINAFEKRLFLRAKHMYDWMSVWGTPVTGTVLTATEFCDFYVLVTTLTPPISKKNVTVACKTFR